MRTLLSGVVGLLLLGAAWADEADDLVAKAKAAHGKRQWEEARGLLTKAIAKDGKRAEAYDLRGSVHFMLGRFRESVADFDQFLKLKPEEKKGHWRRGISLYYTGQFADGAKQFEAYEATDTNDVENSVWHLMCLTKKDGLAAARKRLLKIGFDKRVPMMEVYDLFAGKKKPEDVIKAAEAGDVPARNRLAQRFYAHLYLGLYHEITGDAKKSLEHMQQATEKYKLGGYMWEVARVHYETRKGEARKKAD